MPTAFSLGFQLVQGADPDPAPLLLGWELGKTGSRPAWRQRPMALFAVTACVSHSDSSAGFHLSSSLVPRLVRALDLAGHGSTRSRFAAAVFLAIPTGWIALGSIGGVIFRQRAPATSHSQAAIRPASILCSIGSPRSIRIGRWSRKLPSAGYGTSTDLERSVSAAAFRRCRAFMWRLHSSRSCLRANMGSCRLRYRCCFLSASPWARFCSVGTTLSMYMPVCCLSV